MYIMRTINSTAEMQSNTVVKNSTPSEVVIIKDSWRKLLAEEA